MIEIIPAILPKNYSDLNEKLSRFINCTNVVQIDVCDGNFVPSFSWPMQKSDVVSVEKILNEEEGMPFWDRLDFEFDLMVMNAHKKFDFFSRLGAKRLIFHLEAETQPDFKEFLESMDPYLRDNINIGIAINTTTDISLLEPYMNNIDFVQCMGIENIGFQGQKFDERFLKQIEKLRIKYPELYIAVDGGVNERTAAMLVKAGANKLVVGSLLIESYDPASVISELSNL